jgi:hypothetical protein
LWIQSFVEESNGIGDWAETKEVREREFNSEE